MSYNYLYLEDAIDESRAYVTQLERNRLVKVTMKAPTSISNEIAYIKENLSKIDGLILDLRLDDKKNEVRANYIAPDLAKEIRINSAKRVLNKEMPIILLSTQNKIDKTIALTYSSDDLFDYKLRKDEITKCNFDRILYAFANAYKELNKRKDFSRIFKIKDQNDLDQRIIGSFHNTRRADAVDYISFILNEMILRSGTLINENVLAARLGVDVDKSRDWNILKEKISTFKFNGILSKAWERWWAHKIILWWKDKIDSQVPLANLTAEKRVELLKKHLKLKNLQASKPIKHCTSTRFWTVCQVYKKPLDPIEGYQVQEKEPEPWQDVNYVSLNSLLERKNINSGIEITPLEKDRFKEIKKTLK